MLHATARSYKTNPPESVEPCSDCASLRSGERTTPKPHEYQVLVRRNEATGAPSYRCLVCKTELTHQTEGILSRWK